MWVFRQGLAVLLLLLCTLLPPTALADAPVSGVQGVYFVLSAKHSAKVLDVSQLSMADGGNVHQWTYWGGDNQEWQFQDAGNGYYYIRAKHSGKYLDVSGMSLADGANVYQWTYWGGDNQQWMLQDAGNGYYFIKSKHSGKYLEVSGGSTANGSNIDQWAFTGGANQQWKLEERNESAYPTQSAYKIKGLRTDFILTDDDVIGNNAGNIGVNLVWSQWEPYVMSPPCGAGQFEYDNHCFIPPQQLVDHIRNYSSRNVNVTGVLYGVPDWARGSLPCTSPVAPIFCIPDHKEDFARFAGMIAAYFDGTKNNGRVVNFVIYNEVNTNEWFDIGCVADAATCQNQRGEIYSSQFNAAYDQIVIRQKNAKVFISLDHYFFGTRASDPTGTSGQRIVEAVNRNAAGRHWRVAYHPYSVNLFNPHFSPDDYTSNQVTFGNLGQLAGWLRSTFPNQAYAWDIHLTESGFNTTTESEQNMYLCRSFWNVLGTPGISSYLYHRELDFGAAEGGLNLGLIRSNYSYKPSWATWALANRNDVSPAILSCGFENLPYIALVRSYNPQRGHWASSRVPPDGFVQEAAWKLLRNPKANTRMLYECAYMSHNFLTSDPNCEGQPVKLGPVGYIYNSQVAGTVPIYRCAVNSGQDHFISGDAGCESQQREQLLGYAAACGSNQCRLPN